MKRLILVRFTLLLIGFEASQEGNQGLMFSLLERQRFCSGLRMQEREAEF